MFHDIRWPGRRFANIDHVVVGPGGLFVIDTKLWSGEITVKDNVLRQNGRLRETAVASAAEAALSVCTMAPAVDVDLVHPVLCFAGDRDLTGWVRDVMVCSTSNVVAMLMTRPAVLAPEAVREASMQLDAQFRAAAAAANHPGALPHRTTAPARAQSASRVGGRGRRSRSRKELIRLAVAIGFLVLLVSSPELLTGAASTFAEWFVEAAAK